jgi:hypothetical protein
MTQREIDKFIKQHIIKEIDSSFKLHQGYLLSYPIEDIVAGYCFERSSIDSGIYLNRFAQPLYMLDKYFYLTFGNRIKNKYGNERWLIKDSNGSPQNAPELIASLKANDEFIKEMQDPNIFYDYAEKRGAETGNIRILEAQVYTAFWLKKPDAILQAKELITSINQDVDMSIAWVQEVVRLLQVLIDTSDPIGVLTEYKIQTSHNLKL